MGKRKKRIEPSQEERIRRDPTLQLLRRRIAYREPEFLSLSREEQSEYAQRKLRERIAYHEAKLAEERAARGEDAASGGQ
ncbi:MAG: hypothetical protein E6G22_08355 [Actinobacteria bacterium]|nr:MAG: hypothetical protein E6G22_08355 [Actinomycetota bacterium]